MWWWFRSLEVLGTIRSVNSTDPLGRLWWLWALLVESIFSSITEVMEHAIQVRSRMASLDGIVPPTHGLTVATAGMVNVWLSMEHQSILWCNQMAVQVLKFYSDNPTGRPETP